MGQKWLLPSPEHLVAAAAHRFGLGLVQENNARVAVRSVGSVAVHAARGVVIDGLPAG